MLLNPVGEFETLCGWHLIKGGIVQLDPHNRCVQVLDREGREAASASYAEYDPPPLFNLDTHLHQIYAHPDCACFLVAWVSRVNNKFVVGYRFDAANNRLHELFVWRDCYHVLQAVAPLSDLLHIRWMQTDRGVMPHTSRHEDCVVLFNGRQLMVVPFAWIVGELLLAPEMLGTLPSQTIALPGDLEPSVARVALHDRFILAYSRNVRESVIYRYYPTGDELLATYLLEPQEPRHDLHRLMNRLINLKKIDVLDEGIACWTRYSDRVDVYRFKVDQFFHHATWDIPITTYTYLARELAALFITPSGRDGLCLVAFSNAPGCFGDATTFTSGLDNVTRVEFRDGLLYLEQYEVRDWEVEDGDELEIYNHVYIFPFSKELAFQMILANKVEINFTKVIRLAYKRSEFMRLFIQFLVQRAKEDTPLGERARVALRKLPRGETPDGEEVVL